MGCRPPLRWSEVPGRTSLASVQTFPSGAGPGTRWLPYYCALACRSWPSLPSASSKQQQHDQFHHLDFTARESSLVTEDHRSSSAILPTALLPDKPRLRPKAVIQSCALLQTLVSVTQSVSVPFPATATAPATPQARTQRPWLSRAAAARARQRAAPCMPQGQALTHGCAALQTRLEASRPREPSTWQLWHLLSAISR